MITQNSLSNCTGMFEIEKTFEATLNTDGIESAYRFEAIRNTQNNAYAVTNK